MIFDLETGRDRRGIDAFILPVALWAAIGFAIFAPKIYIANEIYITSLEIERSRSTLESLQDMNARLRRETERLLTQMENPYAEE